MSWHALKLIMKLALSIKKIMAQADHLIIHIQSEKRKTIKEKFFEKLIERDGNLCFYSNKEMTKEQASIEHLIPLSKGGKNNMDNLVLCLKDENLKMGNLPLVEKIKYKILNIK
jgi:5-methylcytosine-specific restriction endonuclease McrA